MAKIYCSCAGCGSGKIVTVAAGEALNTEPSLVWIVAKQSYVVVVPGFNPIIEGAKNTKLAGNTKVPEAGTDMGSPVKITGALTANPLLISELNEPVTFAFG